MLRAAWDFVVSWAGVDMIAGALFVAVAVLEPPIIAALIPDLRKWAIAGAVVAFTLTGTIGYGFKLGSASKQSAWDAALARETVAGEKARADAVRSVGAVDASRRVFNNDPNNRDRGKHASEPGGSVRWLGSHSLLGR